LIAPRRYLGDKSASYGGTLAFRFSVVDNPIVKSTFSATSGVVILSNDPTYNIPAILPGKGDEARLRPHTGNAMVRSD
jgi:Laminin B (Domain IV)